MNTLKDIVIREQKDFQDELLKLDKKEIMDRAFQISVRQEIARVLLSDSLSDEYKKFLEKFQNPVGLIYDEYIADDDDPWTAEVSEIVSDLVSDYER